MTPPALPVQRVQIYIQDNAFILVKGSHSFSLSLDGSLTSLERKALPQDTKPYEVHGIIGIVQGFINKYLLVITHAKDRGALFGHHTHSIEKTICVPLDPVAAKRTLAVQKLDETEFDDASLSNSFIGLGVNEPTTNHDTSGDDRSPSGSSSSATATAVATTATATGTLSPPPSSSPRGSPSFLDRLKKSFDKSPSPVTLDDDVAPPALSPSSRLSSSQNLPADSETSALEKRLVREITSLFGRSMFLYAYDYDLTNTYQRAFQKKQASSTVDHRFWWNEHLSQSFLDAKAGDMLVRVLQGTIQIEPCAIEGFPFTFALISRRSRERAGLRYQRRGVNDEGQVANFVETEQLVFFQRDQVYHVASFVQTRGSIPLFWSQSPYSLHPDPVLLRSDQENLAAIEKHFQRQETLYGKQVVVNLTELTGREAIVGSEYRHYIETMGDPNIKYIEFDFHHETKGMRFENINKLSNSLSDTMDKMGYFWEDDRDTVFCEQSGVFRTNCMDCLDRTNIVQSAFARHVLNLQLMRFGISEYPDQGIKYYGDFERIFNNVWANNGDAISRMYTGTSALKGDFTRTGKRNITGLMNDASNSVARMYFNTVKDFWRQATVDYVLGYHNLSTFKTVPTSQQRTQEPGMDKWLDKVRQDAIHVSSQIVIADDETVLHGWTLLVPKETASGKELLRRFEEKVVLLTAKALYVCGYNYHLEKVVEFKRIDLATIGSIQIGDYILSTLSAETRNPDLHYGFRVFYNEHGLLMRWNTGSMVNKNLNDLNFQMTSHDMDDHDTAWKDRDDDDHDDDASSVTSAGSSTSSLSTSMTPLYKDMKHLTFKAVPCYIPGSQDNDTNAKQHIDTIVQQIMDQCGHPDPAKFLSHQPIISLKQAEKSDGLLKKVGYKLKQAIWV
ncbi:hypothetical protein DM01DRAFT_1339064 [Hesseltinella vesiculosa]|uniref:SAC domain-containing protein n=1 Tax=Hesseltinella vesiculosa TaxID=101127 RepID=A0A1X2G7Z3_9FUNG|nr:hypothetical protein DM01DRAFT_1339064 [Hesseltinella vesiculosa]